MEARPARGRISGKGGDDRPVVKGPDVASKRTGGKKAGGAEDEDEDGRGDKKGGKPVLGTLPPQ